MASNIYTSQFATKAEVTSEINQKANEISLVVNEKLDEEDFTHAEIVAKINDDTSQVQIGADKVDIKANDVINILAGNTLNLTSKAIAIDSTNFKVTPQGNLTATNANISGTITSSNANITGGRIQLLTEGYNEQDIKVTDTRTGVFSVMTPNQINLWGPNNAHSLWHVQSPGLGWSSIDFYDDRGYTEVRSSGITTPEVIQTSVESQKKNIAKYKQKAIELVKNSDIYEFNYKSENEKDKKHIGFVIGDLGGNYRTPNEVISTQKDGIDTYSMLAILWKAVQEQQEQIEEMKKEINKLKGEQ